jgi:uncharacterized protein YyaL (SSP411 family)
VNLLRLSALADHARRDRYLQIAETTLLRHSEQATRNAAGMANLIAALDLWQNGHTLTILVEPDSPTGAAEAQALRQASLAQYVPDHFVLSHRPGKTLPPPFHELVEDKTARDGRATAYVCRGTRCTAPITDPTELRDLLRRPGSLF